MNAWAELATRTEEMLEAARVGAFERVAALEAERRALLDIVPPPDEAARALLGVLLERDREVAALVEIARAQTAEDLRLARQVQAGAGVYLGVAHGAP